MTKRYFFCAAVLFYTVVLVAGLTGESSGLARGARPGRDYDDGVFSGSFVLNALVRQSRLGLVARSFDPEGGAVPPPRKAAPEAPAPETLASETPASAKPEPSEPGKPAPDRAEMPEAPRGLSVPRVPDADLDEAARLLAKGKFQEAYAAYLGLLARHPGDDRVNLGLARAAAGAGRLHQAVLAYEMLLEKYPGETALYREIAAAWMAAGDRETAGRYLNLDPSLSPDDAAAWATRAERTYSRLQTQGKLRFGLTYDSNANQGPGSNRISLGRFDVTLGNGATEQGAFGGWVAGDYDLAWRTSRSGPWWVVGDAHFNIRGLDSSALSASGNWYSQWFRAAAGVRHVNPDWLLDLRIKGEAFDYDFFNTVYSVGPELTLVRAFSRKFQLVTRAGVERREYVRNPDHDGTYGYAGEYARFTFGKEGANELTVGGRYLWGDAESRRASYDGWEASASARVALKGGWDLTPSVSYSEENYRAPATVLESDSRRDKRLRLGLGVTYRIDKDWSAELSYHYTDNKSNSSLHQYDKHAVMLGLSRTF